MVRRLAILAVLLAGACGTLEASTTDTGDAGDAGGPDAADAGIDAEQDDGDPLDSAGKGDGGGMTFFVNTLYPSIITTCGDMSGCHGATTGAEQFFEGDAPKTYNRFKFLHFDELDSGFEQKGLHTGPALTNPQMKLYETWTKLEHP
jgi:hypothetical protein